MGGISSSSSVNIGDLIGGGVQGSVIFLGASGALEQRNANFFWDDTNFRLGIGTVTPGASLNVAGTIQATGKDALLGGSGGVELAFDTVSNTGKIWNYDRTALAYRRLDIQGPLSGTGSGNTGVWIGGNNPTLTNGGAPLRVYLDGKPDSTVYSGVGFDGPNSSNFLFAQNGITWQSSSMLQWSNTSFANQIWSIGQNTAGAGIKITSVLGGDMLVLNTVAATGALVSVQVAPKFYPPQDSGALQSNVGIYGGAGAPNNANGANGDYYFRNGAAGSRIYFKTGGAWTAIV